MGAVLHQEKNTMQAQHYKAKPVYYVLGSLLGILLTLEQHLLLAVRSKRSTNPHSIQDICPKAKVRHLKRCGGKLVLLTALFLSHLKELQTKINKNARSHGKETLLLVFSLLLSRGGP